jgi:hypothetical protein
MGPEALLGKEQDTVAEQATCDMRPLLGDIAVPTLVVARSDLAIGTGMAQHLAERIPEERYVTVPGAEIVPFLGDSESVLAEIREHLTCDRFAAHPERVLAAVLFTDLAGSTDGVVRCGDGPWRSLLLDRSAMVRQEARRSTQGTAEPGA